MKIKNKTIFGFHKKKLNQWFLFWGVVGFGFLALTFFITSTLIGIDVRERCLISQAQYKGDCVEALIQVIDDETNSFDERNRAIWALGQMGDIRGKQVLEKYYTGIIPSKEPYNKTLSQYEMKKALKLVNGGLNITHYVWGKKDIE